MDTYIATVWAKPGSETEVARFYTELGDQYDNAPGFQGRQILQARTGTMVEAVKRIRTQEELEAHPADAEAKGTHFIIVEQWDSVDDRINFSRNLDKSRAAKLFPHLLPEHTHEFYSDVAQD
jgi:heme-degrading monooxygenase HmoA